MRLVAALGALLLPNRFLPLSKALHRRLHMSMFWKHDFTLQHDLKRVREEGGGRGEGLTQCGYGLLRAVREVQQVCHGDKGVVESLHGRDALVGVQRQHLLQQVYELPPVGLLCQDVRPLQVGHVDLRGETQGHSCTILEVTETQLLLFPAALPHLHHIIQTVEDVFPRLLRLDAHLCLVLRGRLQEKKHSGGQRVSGGGEVMGPIHSL